MKFSYFFLKNTANCNLSLVASALLNRSCLYATRSHRALVDLHLPASNSLFQSIRTCNTPVRRFNSTDISTNLNVYVENGLFHLHLPLPSREESCAFVLKPLSHTVGELLRFIQEEDLGIDRVAVYRSVSNKQACHSDLDGLRDTVHQLYAALNVDDYQLAQEQRLQQRLEELNASLQPLEEHRTRLAAKAATHTRYITWLGLGAMGLQFGFLARLTWWEYSWDIMEPVTYFIGYGTSIAMFSYYVLTRQDYSFPQVFDREYLKKFYKEADKSALDVNRYNELREAVATVESDLRCLRNPHLLKLPLPQSIATLETEQ